MDKKLKSRMEGALVGRFIGCLFGVPVENYPISTMEEYAKKGNDVFPPIDYWTYIDRENDIQYGISPRKNYSKENLSCVEVDDDITYTVLNLMLLEKYGFHYSIEDVGKLWLDLLPYACTAEDVALRNLKAGMNAKDVKTDKTQTELIGAAIRADAFGYVAAFSPHGAAMMSKNDALLTHDENGVYGEMFLAASISAAFSCSTVLEAIKMGMKEIPVESELYKELEWALSYEGKLKDYKEARKLIDERFPSMHCVHVINNMCVIVFAAILGDGSYLGCVSNAIAIGLDNDCNGASIGSIAGAIYGIEGIPPHLYTRFHDKVRTYLNGMEYFSLDDLVNRFLVLQERYEREEMTK